MVKHGNATGVHIEAIPKETLQRIKEDGLIVEAMTILQKLKDKEPIRELTVMQMGMPRFDDRMISGSSLCQVCHLRHPSSTR